MAEVLPMQPPSLFEYERVEKVIRDVLESYIGDHTNDATMKAGGETNTRTVITRASDKNEQKTEYTRHERFVGYDGPQSAQLCAILSDQIRNRVKQLNYERYKIVCLTQIFENKNQGISSIARLLCDTSRDRYALVQKEWIPVNNSIRAGAGTSTGISASINEGNDGSVATAFLIVSVFAIYYP